MSKKILVLAAIMLTLTLVITSCSVFKDEGKEQGPDVPTITDEDTDELIRETVVYYQDDAGYLVPVMRKIPWAEGIAKATLQVMMDTPDQQESLMTMGLRAILPAETEVLGMSIKDGIATVDFNEAVLNCKDAAAENNMVQGIVMTLAGFSTIEKVQLLFDGKAIETMQFGTVVKDPIDPLDINIEMSDDASTQGAKVTVFFQSTSSSQYEYLIPITRITSSMNVTLETAIQELLDGPRDADNMTIDIPQDTKLLGVQMEDGVTYINFSKEFNSLSTSASSEAMVFKAIMMVARQFPEVEQVNILVEGKNYVGAKPVNSTPVFANEY